MDLNPTTLAAIAVTAGWALLVTGVALIYLPAGVIAAGVLLAAAGLLADWERS